MRCRRSRLLPVAMMSGLMAVTFVAPAFAQGKEDKPLSDAEKKTKAKALYQEATDKFDSGDFKGAIPLFQEADSLIPGAVPKFKVAESYDKMGDAPKAVAAYEAFLASNPDAKKYGDNIDQAKARIEALKKTPAKVKVAVEPPEVTGFTVTVDGVEQAGSELSVTPGKHTITVSAEGYEPATQEFEVTYGEQTQLNLALQPAEGAVPVGPVVPPADPPTKPEPKEERSMVPAYVTLGLAGAGAVVGTIFGIMALGSASDYDDAPSQDLFDETERNALIADMSFGVALTFGVTGVVLLLSGDDGGAKTGASKSTTQAQKSRFQGPKLSPYVGPTGGGAVGTLSF
jgi:hypothetical protein